MSLRPHHVELDEANDFVEQHHRHHAPARGHRFSLGVGDEALRGVAICGRPVGRGIDPRAVLEVVRVCTDGARNACSWLYSHAARCAADMGYQAVVTYTSVEEQGASLRACGWWPEVLDVRGDYSFASKTRSRQAKKGKAAVQKIRWLWLTGNEAPRPAKKQRTKTKAQLDLLEAA